MKILFLILFLPLLSYSQEGKENFKSTKTGDTYEIIIRKPKDFDSTRFYNLILITPSGSDKIVLPDGAGDLNNGTLMADLNGDGLIDIIRLAGDNSYFFYKHNCIFKFTMIDVMFVFSYYETISIFFIFLIFIVKIISQRIHGNKNEILLSFS